MNTSAPSRTWDSVCGDCSRYTGDGCAAGYVTAGSADCIAAVCAGFTPRETHEKENGDA